MSNTFSINPSDIYVYIRVSTRAQTFKSNGLEEQCKICQDFLEKNFPTYKNIKYYTDIGSSYNEKSTLVNLNKLLRVICSEKKSLILVRDISRLGRNTFQVFNLLRKIKKTNSYIIGVEENLCWNYSRLMDRKFSHVVIDSEEHSDLKSIKQSDRINGIKKKGGYVGGIPYGTQIIKKNNIPYIYKNSNEINIIRNIKDEYLKLKNIKKVTSKLNNNITKRGKKWSTTQVSNILKKYFPNVIFDKKSDMIDHYFNKYDNYNNDNNLDINNISETTKRIKLDI